MAGDGDSSVGTWPALIDQINKTFNLVRDAFGYALPGAAFLAIGLMYGRFNLYQVQALLRPYEMPAWMALIVIIAFCYPVGNLMAATAYLPFMIAKYIVWMIYRHPGWFPWSVASNTAAVQAANPSAQSVEERDITEEFEQSAYEVRFRHRERIYPSATDSGAPKRPSPPLPGSPREWLMNHPTEVCQEIVAIRAEQPKLLDTLDRRETLALLAASMFIALFGGWYVFYKAQWPLHDIIFCASLITLVQFLTGIPHLRRVAKATKDYYASREVKPRKTSTPDLITAVEDLVKAIKEVLAAFGNLAPNPGL